MKQFAEIIYEAKFIFCPFRIFINIVRVDSFLLPHEQIFSFDEKLFRLLTKNLVL